MSFGQIVFLAACAVSVVCFFFSQRQAQKDETWKRELPQVALLAAQWWTDQVAWKNFSPGCVEQYQVRMEQLLAELIRVRLLRSRTLVIINLWIPEKGVGLQELLNKQELPLHFLLTIPQGVRMTIHPDRVTVQYSDSPVSLYIYDRRKQSLLLQL